MIVEGFVATEVRKYAVAPNVKIDTSWGSLKLIQEILRATDSLTADQIIGPLKELHYLRSKVPGHHTGERTKLEADAVSQHGSLTAHFRDLCTRCADSFDVILGTLR